MPQERIRSLIDLLTAVALISASVVLIWVSLSGSQTPTSRRPAPPIYKTGEVLEVVDPQDVAAPLTLVMFFRDGCRYCTESMEFYRRLGAEPNRARLLVVGRESVDKLRNYTNENEFHPDGFASIGTKAVKVSGTPTLLLVTADRTIKGIWPGRLDALAEEEVLKSIRR